MYHVLSRGNRQEAIFADDTDRQVSLKTLGEACGRTGWRVHACVLMSNHYHLLLETPEANLVVGMQWLPGPYTQRFNGRHRLTGHLFQGRYKALLIEPGDGHNFTAVSTYIHLNPVRTGIVGVRRGRLEDYVWSSYPGYLKPGCRPPWLCVERILGCHELGDDRRGRLEYRRFMDERVATVGIQQGPCECGPDMVEDSPRLVPGWRSVPGIAARPTGRRSAGKSRASLCGDAIDEHNERHESGCSTWARRDWGCPRNG